jgi:hypothetical protein
VQRTSAQVSGLCTILPKSVSIRDTEDPEIGNAEDAEIAERRFGLRVLRALRVEEF